MMWIKEHPVKVRHAFINFMLAGGLPGPLFEPSWLISTRVEHMCGVGWVGAWGGGCLKTLWLHALKTRGTYVWGGGGLFKDVVVARVEHNLT